MFTVITFLILIAALIADVVTTVKVIQSGGREVNPVQRWFIDRLGLWSGLAVTHIGGAIFFGVVGVWWVNLLVASVFSAVAFHNYGQIRK